MSTQLCYYGAWGHGAWTNIETSLIDKIYEAAIFPERWAAVCDLVSDHVGSYAASVITLGENQTYRWVTSPHNHDNMARFSENPLRFENVRPARHIAESPFAFLRDQDLMTGAEIASDPIYNDVLRPLGVGWSAGDIIIEPSGHIIMFDILRQADRGPFTLAHIGKLNAIRPDLARAALMSSRLAFREAESMAKTLSALSLPSAVIGDGGDVIAVNTEFEALAPRVRTGSRNSLWLTNREANLLFQSVMSQLIAGKNPDIQSIPVSPEAGEKPLIVHVLPIKRESRDVFSKAAAIIIATPVGEVGPPDARVLSGLFDFTGAEARIARMLATGNSIEQISTKFKVSKETVRTHVKKIFQKTGLKRQAELVAMLSGLTTFGA